MNRLQRPTALHDQFVSLMRITTKKDDLDFEAAAALLRSASGELLLRFDDRTRRSWWQYSLANPLERARTVLRTALARPEHAQVILFFEACSENGHVREKALRALRGHTGRLPCAALLLRAEDWVPQVAGLANDLLLKFAATDQAQYFFEFLDLILALHGKSRFAATKPALEAVMLAPRWREQRLGATQNFQGSVRRYALELVFKADQEDRLACLLDAASDPSPLVASWALTVSAEWLPREDSHLLLCRALGNRMSAVRANALRRLVAAGFADARECCLRGLMDRSQTVRWTASILLKRHFDVDALPIWREKFDAGLKRQQLVLALAELGDSGDLDRLRSQLSSRHARSRAIALRGLARLAAPDLPEALERALLDSSGLVISTATQLYSRSSAMPGRDTLQAALSSAGSPSTRARLLWAARVLPKWQQLEYLLANAAGWPEKESEALDRCLQRWLRAANRAFTQLTAEQRADLGKILAALRRDSPNPLLDQIAPHL